MGRWRGTGGDLSLRGDGLLRTPVRPPPSPRDGGLQTRTQHPYRYLHFYGTHHTPGPSSPPLFGPVEPSRSTDADAKLSGPSGQTGPTLLPPPPSFFLVSSHLSLSGPRPRLRTACYPENFPYDLLHTARET